MSFDPNLPQELTQADAAQMRSQFNALKALIDAIQSIQAIQFTSITTLPPGSPATGSLEFSGGVLQIALSLPQGNDGAQGPQGIQGPPGEVTVSELNAAMASVLAQTSNNTNNVATLGMTADSSYQQWQMQALSDKVDEMINAQRR